MMVRIFLIIVGVAGVLILLAVTITVWKIIACKKIKDAVYDLSEHPDDEHAELFVKNAGAVSPIGRFLAKAGRSFAGLSKSDCRSIYNSTILPAGNISAENKKNIRALLTKLGCKGLIDI